MITRLLGLYQDWLEIYELTGYGEYEIHTIAYMLGLE